MQPVWIDVALDGDRFEMVVDYQEVEWVAASRAAYLFDRVNDPRTLGQALCAAPGAEELDETVLLIHPPASLEGLVAFTTSFRQ